jgi:ankyrin repeat protein
MALCLLGGCRQAPTSVPPTPPGASSAPTPAPESELVRAVVQGDREKIKQQLAQSADLEARNATGRTPLALAALKADYETVKLLLEKGANVEAKDDAGLTPLMWAAFGGNPRIVRALLDKGVDVNAKDAHGGTALTWSQKPEIAALLKKAGARE